ncbi:hypothetical protein A3754_08585 [Alcanivorax sp. HI0083]|uniref:hypothetical protein n=1 Tax=unclassified Alcanivorax TaxID=2638842 RepID=UPI0007B859F2|nr:MULTISPECIES: hypothetical protein [unclassified Alcanivorax]KZY35253.1 hypothetical protein A3730_15050 [Alcanivorax sp. HI0044]KZZ27183.1 hypothetical protein A3754_08585 [Alcanivorax sp. HI0083]PHR68571.1 MAG: hypothetical protein COA55_00725 [Alcanivorax sp.]
MSATVRCVHIVTALLALTLLSACSRSPDASDAQKALEAEMRNAHLDGLLEITDVEKQNGYEDGDGRYTVEVSYNLEAQEDLSTYTNQVKGNEDLSGLDRFAMIMALSALRVEHGNFKKGDTFQRQRVIQFRDTEKGWMPLE